MSLSTSPTHLTSAEFATRERYAAAAKAPETALDLGSGTGKICFIASQVVGANGKVIGVDMTDAMLEVARRNAPIVAERLGYANVEFRKGRIQDLALDLERLDADMNRFQEQLQKHHIALTRGTFQTLQINVGRKCNQTCTHCHVDAGPNRTEMMDEETARKIGAWIIEHRPPIVDITGGAPELSEHFRYFVETAKDAGAHIIDRNNLTIIETKSYTDLPEFLARHEVEVVASLPCYLEKNVDGQRGDGVFAKSIRALRKLNAVGYGTRLPLTLVYNPLGPKLPPDQVELEADYKRELKQRYGIEFTRLFTITNQPIARFADDLRAHGQWDAYLDLLANSFNPGTVSGLMCRSTISVGWRGEVFDCDFNQMLGMQLRNGDNLYLWDVTPHSLGDHPILTAKHCLACTAGAGSSCGGALTTNV